MFKSFLPRQLLNEIELSKNDWKFSNLHNSICRDEKLSIAFRTLYLSSSTTVPDVTSSAHLISALPSSNPVFSDNPYVGLWCRSAKWNGRISWNGVLSWRGDDNTVLPNLWMELRINNEIFRRGWSSQVSRYMENLCTFLVAFLLDLFEFVVVNYLSDIMAWKWRRIV